MILTCRVRRFCLSDGIYERRLNVLMLMRKGGDEMLLPRTQAPHPNSEVAEIADTNMLYLATCKFFVLWKDGN